MVSQSTREQLEYSLAGTYALVRDLGDRSTALFPRIQLCLWCQMEWGVIVGSSINELDEYDEVTMWTPE